MLNMENCRKFETDITTTEFTMTTEEIPEEQIEKGKITEVSVEVSKMIIKYCY